MPRKINKNKSDDRKKARISWIYSHYDMDDTRNIGRKFKMPKKLFHKYLEARKLFDENPPGKLSGDPVPDGAEHIC